MTQLHGPNLSFYSNGYEVRIKIIWWKTFPYKLKPTADWLWEIDYLHLLALLLLQWNQWSTLSHSSHVFRNQIRLREKPGMCLEKVTNAAYASCIQLQNSFTVLSVIYKQSCTVISVTSRCLISDGPSPAYSLLYYLQVLSNYFIEYISREYISMN